MFVEKHRRSYTEAIKNASLISKIVLDNFFIFFFPHDSLNHGGKEHSLRLTSAMLD